MCRVVFVVLGLLELVVAAVLVGLGWQLPGQADIDHSFDSAERVTQRAGDQVRLARRHVQELRRPQIQQLAERLQTQTRTVTAALRSQQVDYATVRTLRDVMGDTAEGLDRMSGTLNPDGLKQLGDGLGATASFLDGGLVPGAEQAADQMDRSTADLAADAERLSALLREAPLDLKAAQEVHDSLGRFGEGLDRMSASLRVQRLQTMREGFQGLEESLTTGAEQVERLSGYSYPVVRFDGLKPVVEQQPFWPEGGKIAEGMRKAAGGTVDARKQLDEMAADLPHVQASLEESRKVVERTREALGQALAKRGKVEPLLRDVPAHAARLAEELPTLGRDLSRILRDTRKLREVAAALRQTQKGLDEAAERWPDLRATLSRSAVFLRTTRGQLDRVLQNRQQYEAAMGQTVALAETFAALLPLLADQIAAQLREEEESLDGLGHDLDQLGATLPAYAESTSAVVRTGRLLSWLVAAIVALHGAYLLLSVGLGRRFSV